MDKTVENEKRPEYVVGRPKLDIKQPLISEQDSIIMQALDILANRLTEPEMFVTNPQTVKDYFMLKLANKPNEVVAVMYLNNQHGLIKFEEVFQGTIDSCIIYPREIARRVLKLGAVAIIIAHNHPSGVPDPSKADIEITNKLKEVLAMLDVKLLDHIVVCRDSAVSLAERGYI